MTGVRSPFKLARQAAWYRANGKADIAERLEAQLAAVGRCRRCGRALSDPVSVERSVGPECWSKDLHEKTGTPPAPEPHRVILRREPAGYQRAHAYGSWRGAEPGCRWTWDGIGGGFDDVREEHEKLNGSSPRPSRAIDGGA